MELKFVYIVKKIIRYITINRSYTFVGSKKELVDGVKTSDLQYAFEDDNKIGFCSRFSFGTLKVNYTSYPIKVNATIEKAAEGQLKVALTTRIRPEHYLVAFGFAAFVVTGIIQSADSSVNMYVLIAWVVMHLWSHFIYRLQENRLVRKIVAALHLKASPRLRVSAETITV